MQVAVHKPLQIASIQKPIVGLRNNTAILQLILSDLYPIVTNGNPWVASANANGFSTLGLNANVTNVFPTAFDRYCQIYSQYTIMQIDMLFVPYVYSSVALTTSV